MADKIWMDYFNSLHKDRTDTADTLEKPSMRGIWRSVTDIHYGTLRLFC